MGKRNFTLISSACIFWQAFEKAGVFLDTLPGRLALQFIQQQLFRPIFHSKKPYCRYCKRTLDSFAVLLRLGFFYFRWGRFLRGLKPALLKPTSSSRTKQSISIFPISNPQEG